MSRGVPQPVCPATCAPCHVCAQVLSRTAARRLAGLCPASWSLLGAVLREGRGACVNGEDPLSLQEDWGLSSGALEPPEGLWGQRQTSPSQ